MKANPGETANVTNNAIKYRSTHQLLEHPGEMTIIATAKQFRWQVMGSKDKSEFCSIANATQRNSNKIVNRKAIFWDRLCHQISAP
jgi:hypothetical protein